jgi:hypothetical protein
MNRHDNENKQGFFKENCYTISRSPVTGRDHRMYFCKESQHFACLGLAGCKYGPIIPMRWPGLEQI